MASGARAARVRDRQLEDVSVKHPRIVAGICLGSLLAVVYAAGADSWTCHKSGLTRQVVVFYPDAPAALPCQVFYSKPNENVVPRALWEAQNLEGYCERKAAQFVARLESWGWRCVRDQTDGSAPDQPDEETPAPE